MSTILISTFSEFRFLDNDKTSYNLKFKKLRKKKPDIKKIWIGYWEFVSFLFSKGVRYNDVM